MTRGIQMGHAVDRRSGNTRIRSILVTWLFLGIGVGVNVCSEENQGVTHVYPGDSIQEALDRVALQKLGKEIWVHEGVYRPEAPRQALIWFNRRHDGIQLKAQGKVVLTAANPELSDPSAESHPAIVNHVVYFGHGISTNTLLEGFEITGANLFVTRDATRRMEPDRTLPKGLFFYADGGGIKIFGKSYPTLKGLDIHGNVTRPCGAGISVQHEGIMEDWVVIQDCVIRENRTQVTGAAVDLLPGSAAKIINCLFYGNVSNTGEDVVASISGEAPFTNSGVLTVFSTSQAIVERCTFVGNRNGVDDMSPVGVYKNCIFYRNDLTETVWPETVRYEVDFPLGASLFEGCWVSGRILDPKNSLSIQRNRFNSPNPDFDEHFVPRHPEVSGIGYRPVPRELKVP